MSETFIKIDSLQNLEIPLYKFETLIYIYIYIYKKDIQERAKSPKVNEIALIQVVRKRVRFQDRMNESTPKFPSIKI